MQNYFEFTDEIKEALRHKKPVLALESTLITHGLPYPINIETALELEKIAREQDVIPATIAVMDGKIKIGLSQNELETLVQDKQAIKASCRDLSYALIKKLNAGTTVAATLNCAHLAGINIFATGGIGGVHRGDSLDISADLIELSHTPVAVVCAGAKAILDLPKTLEYLETHSIPVIGYNTHQFPAFYTAESAYDLTMHTDDIVMLAKMLKMHWRLGLNSGVVIANPIPSADEILSTDIEPIIDQALLKLQKEKIIGKAITPFLLQEVLNATQGKSMQANISLIKNNVSLGAKLSLAFTQLGELMWKMPI